MTGRPSARLAVLLRSHSCGFAPGVDLFLDVPDFAPGEGLVNDALGFLLGELGLVARALGGVAPLLRGHRALFVAYALGQIGTSCYCADGKGDFSCGLEVCCSKETRLFAALVGLGNVRSTAGLNLAAARLQEVTSDSVAAGSASPQPN